MKKSLLCLLIAVLPPANWLTSSTEATMAGYPVTSMLSCEEVERNLDAYPWSIESYRSGDKVIQNFNLDVEDGDPGLRSVTLDLDIHPSIDPTKVSVSLDSSWCFNPALDGHSWCVDWIEHTLQVKAQVSPCEFRKGSGQLLQLEFEQVPSGLEADSTTGNLSGILHVDNI